MKLESFIVYTLIFCAVWLCLSALGWVPAQALSQSLLMPWVMKITNLWPHTVALAIGGAIAILGAFMATMVLLVVLVALEAIRHFLQNPSANIPS
jgi:hypothetical protein